VLATLEEGKAVTRDVARLAPGGDVEEATSTTGFTDAVIGNLGRAPSSGSVAGRRPAAAAADREQPARWTYAAERYATVERRLVGVDLYVETDEDVAALGSALEGLAGERFRLEMIASRGTVVYPSDAAADSVRWYRCRFVAAGEAVSDADVAQLYGRVAAERTVSETHRLTTFDGEEGFTKAAGQ
jgi:hypothetical protein